MHPPGAGEQGVQGAGGEAAPAALAAPMQPVEAATIASGPVDKNPAVPVNTTAPGLSVAPSSAMTTPSPAPLPNPAPVAATPDGGMQPARALKPLPPPLPASAGTKNPPRYDTSLETTLPAGLTSIQPAAIPAQMSRALDSYRKLLEQRDRQAVPVPGLDFQS